MAGIITTGSHPRLLLGDISELFGAHYKQLDAMNPMVFKKKSSQRNYEEAVQLVGLDMAEKKGQGEPITLDATSQGYARRTYHEVWQKSAKITMEAVSDNRHLNQAAELSKHLARSLFHAKETNASAMFNNATSSSAPYVSADGQPLLSASHTLGGGGTYSNLSSSDLSELAIENAMITMAGWVDNNNLLINTKVKGLLVPPNNRYEAHRILRSDLRAGTAENDTNAVKDRNDIPQILEWRFLTDTDSWFLLTDQEGLCCYERMAAKPSYEQEYLTKDHIYTIMERYSFDHYDERAVFGSVGA
jgi:hypothetical protein